MKNSFESQKLVDERILDENEKVIGVIRIKPSGVSWKPKGLGKFYTVSLATFTDWITKEETKAARTKM